MDLNELMSDGLFKELDKELPVALAVSGGADSLAMLHLFAEWRLANPLKCQEKDLVLSVDHGLRVEAASEVAFVVERACELGFAAVPLKINGLNSGAGLQERARAARYEAMAAAMKGRGFATLLTAHTLDDQAETFLMRLRRGSGLEGLSGILPSRDLFGITLVRPLLELSKQQLIDWLQARQITWQEDPSNQDLSFERVEVRALLKQISGAGDLKRQITESARRLGEARVALDVWSRDFLSSNGCRHCDGRLTIEGAEFAALPFAVRVQVLKTVFALFGGKAGLAKIERCVAHIPTMAGAMGERFALGGVMISKIASGDLVFYREVGREPLEVIELDPAMAMVDELAFQVIWDRRVKLVFPKCWSEPICIRAFETSEAEQVLEHQRLFLNERDKVKMSDQVKSPPFLLDVLRGLVTIWSVPRGVLLRVPQLPFHDEQMVCQAFEAEPDTAIDVEADWAVAL